MASADHLVLVEYDPRWPQWFEEIRVAMEAVLDGIDATVEHVGSTAVPGLMAKPIIDVDIVLASADDVGETLDRLETIGYERKGDRGVEGREMLQPPENLPYHHPYVVVRGDKAHLDHVLFRDLLRRDPDACREYAAEKRRNEHHLEGDDIRRYVDGKAAFVQGLLVRARDEAGLPQPMGVDIDGISYRWRADVDAAEIDVLVATAFGEPSRTGWWRRVRSYSMGWITAHEGESLIGFVNVITDGGKHAFLLDLAVRETARHRSIATKLVGHAIERARAGDCEWLHVDFADDLAPLYVDALGFEPTAAGVFRLVD